MLNHVVLGEYLQSEPKDGGQEQAFAHRAGSEGGLGREDCEVGVQVVHALAEDALHGLLGEDGVGLLREDKDLGQLPVLLKVLEGPKQVLMACEQIVHISTIRVAYIQAQERG